MSYHLQLRNDMKPFQHTAPRQRSLFLLVMLMSSCAVMAQERSAQRSVMDPHFKTVAYGKDHVRSLEERYLLPVAFQDLPQREVVGKIYGSLGVMLQSAAAPQAQGQPKDPGKISRIRIFAAMRPDQDDTVEYQWTYIGQLLTAVCTRHGIRLAIDLDELAKNGEFAGTGISEIDRARAFVAHLIRLEGEDRYERPYKLQIPWPDDLKDGASFSTNPDRNINSIGLWQDRLDAYVEGRTLYFIFYKKPGQLMHFQDGSRWFPEEFRAWVHETARQQGKLPSIDAKVEKE